MAQHTAAPHYSSDGIDIRDLLQTLWASRALIILTIAILTGIAIAYAFISTPIYQTSVHTLPPTASGLASYNIASQLTGESILGTVAESAEGIEPLTTEDAYRIFLRHLNSNTVRQNFFEEHYLPAQKHNTTKIEVQDAWKRLNEELRIVLPKGSDGIDASLILEGSEPTTIAGWANTYIELAKKVAQQEIINALTGEVTIRAQSLRQQISALRAVGEKERQDQIARLKNALAIAESIDLERPADATPLIAINTQHRSNTFNEGGLMYLRGAKALRAELQLLEQRTTDDAYIHELSDLLKKQALLENIDLNPDLLSVVTIDRSAVVPEEPIKPKKGLIITLGFILGLVLAPFFVLIRILISTYRRPVTA